MTWLLIFPAWFLLSIPFGLIVGQMIEGPAK